MKNEDVVAVAVAVDEPVAAEVLVNASNQRDSGGSLHKLLS